MKMEPIVSSETSAIKTQTPGNYPKRNKLQLYLFIHVIVLSNAATKSIVMIYTYRGNWNQLSSYIGM